MTDERTALRIWLASVLTYEGHIETVERRATDLYTAFGPHRVHSMEEIARGLVESSKVLQESLKCDPDTIAWPDELARLRARIQQHPSTFNDA